MDLLSGSWPGELYSFAWEDGVFGNATAILGEDGEPLIIGKATNAAAIDWDGDGDQDLVAGEFWGGVYVLDNKGGEDLPRFSNGGVVTIDGFDLKGLGGHSGVSVADWDGDGRADLLFGTDTGAVHWVPDTSEQAGFQPGFPRQLLPPRSAVAKNDFVQQVGSRTKISVCDWNGDGRQDLLVGDMQQGSGFQADINGGSSLIPRDDLTQDQRARFDAIQDLMADLSRQFDAAVNDRSFWGDGWSDQEQEEKAQARVSAIFEQMEPLEKEREALADRVEGDTHGYVWVCLRK